MDDGYVLPHFLSWSGEEPSGYAKSLNDGLMRIGRVVKVYPPDDKGNRNGKFNEYDVEIEHTDSGANFTSVIYPRARIASLFGGAADFTRFTPRIASPKPQKVNEGSQVLVLCINGDTQQAVIIGGIPHPNLPKEDPADGHHSVQTFNGVSFAVNKDGELEIKMRGATKLDGSLADSADPEAEGSYLAFKQNGKVELEAKEEMFFLARRRVNIESEGVSLGGEEATEAQLLATTYRAEQKALHEKLMSELGTLSSALSTAAGAMTDAALIAPPLSGASSAMSSASSAASSMKSAIEAFEAKSAEFLSQFHKLT